MSFQIFANAKITSFVFSNRGKLLATRLPFEIVEPKEKKYIKTEIEKAFLKYDAIIFFTAVPIAVRFVAPLLETKHNDPAIVVVDENSKFAVSLISSHKEIVNANLLSSYVADLLDSTDVITNLTDLNGKVSIDLFRDFKSDGNVSQISRKIADGDTIYYEQDKHARLPLKITKSKQFIKITNSTKNAPSVPDIVVTSDPHFNSDSSLAQVLLRAKNLNIGIGLSTNANFKQLLAFVEKTFHRANLSLKAVKSINTIDIRRDHPAIVELSHKLDIPINYYSSIQLASVNVPNPSKIVSDTVGTASVAEAAALINTNEHSKLLIDKAKTTNLTMAVSLIQPVKKVNLIGIGPGSIGLLTPKAIQAIRESDAIIGYSVYNDYIRKLTNTSQLVEDWNIGEETERVQAAIDYAQQGYCASVICSGDSGIYAMASLFFEVLDVVIKKADKMNEYSELKVEIIPGITAATSSASKLGAPLGNDFAAISLSDLHTNKKLIKQRIDATLKNDFALAVYNPKSNNRDELLKYLIDQIKQLRGPNTLVGVVKNAYREGESVELLHVKEIDLTSIDMNTTLIVGSSNAKQVLNYFYTPRGYSL
jgi:cobalt-precorrin 5A hydrolase/precorrin-3B C17-methyltransferase